MKRAVHIDHRDKLIAIGIRIAMFRKMRGLTQEQLAEKAGVSRSFLSLIEGFNVPTSFSVDLLLSISDALEVRPEELLNTESIEL